MYLPGVPRMWATFGLVGVLMIARRIASGTCESVWSYKRVASGVFLLSLFIVATAKHALDARNDLFRVLWFNRVSSTPERHCL